MTNQQIIADIASSIYGEDAVIRMIENGEDIPLHTVKGWNSRGPYRIKKGEHGIETRLWKKRKKKNTDTLVEDENAGETGSDDFYLAKAFLFRKDQVEIVDE